VAARHHGGVARLVHAHDAVLVQVLVIAQLALRLGLLLALLVLLEHLLVGRLGRLARPPPKEPLADQAADTTAEAPPP